MRRLFASFSCLAEGGRGLKKEAEKKLKVYSGESPFSFRLHAKCANVYFPGGKGLGSVHVLQGIRTQKRLRTTGVDQEKGSG